MNNTKQIYFIGETAFHHQGDISYLKKLIDEAAQLKLSAIKFHLLFDVDDYFVSEHSAYEVIKEWLFTKEQWAEIISYANEMKLDVIALCNDVASLKWINTTCQTPIKAVEIHATGINDLFLLTEAAKSKATVMLGIGGCDVTEIHFAIENLRNNGKEDIVLMYGFQNYPTNFEDINLSKIELLREIFKLPVGYADHTDPQSPLNEIVSAAAIFKGVDILEKHFTIDISEKRIDSQAAISIAQMKKFMELSTTLKKANGKGGLSMSLAEKKYGDTGPMKKAIVARQNISKGKKIERADLAFKRIEESVYIKQKEILTLIGTTAICDINKNAIIDYNKLQYEFKVNDNAQFFNK